MGSIVTSIGGNTKDLLIQIQLERIEEQLIPPTKDEINMKLI